MTQTKILVVEDEVIIARDLQLQLESMGFAVPALAATGKDAVLKAEQFRPDLILMDIMLSDEIDGIEAAGQIRSRFSIPVVYITAHADKKILERSKATEPYGYLVKPISSRNLQATIEMSIHKSELEKKMAKTVLEIADKEQIRIGQDLHDDLGQLLTGISYKIRALQERMKLDFSEDALFASEISELVDHAKHQLKQMIKGMLPFETGENALISTMEELAGNTRKIFSVPCNLTYSKHISILDKTAVMHLYRIAKEAVTNAVRHSTPEHIEISLSKNNGKVKLTIKDDGTGIQEANKHKNGMGLTIMNYRANMIGASLDILSETGRGTSVICTYDENGKDRIKRQQV